MKELRPFYLISVFCVFLFAFSNCKKKGIEIPVDISFHARADTSNVELTLFFDGKNEGEVPHGSFGCDDSGALVIVVEEGEHSYEVTNRKSDVLYSGIIHIEKKIDPNYVFEETKGDQGFGFAGTGRKIHCMAVEVIVDHHH